MYIKRNHRRKNTFLDCRRGANKSTNLALNLAISRQQFTRSQAARIFLFLSLSPLIESNLFPRIKKTDAAIDRREILSCKIKEDTS